MEKQNSDYYREFRYELCRRTKNPLSDVTFLFYLVFGVIFFSGFGVIVEISKYWYSGDPFSAVSLSGVRAGIAVLFPALIGAASLQLALEATKKTDTLLLVFAICALLMMIIVAVILGIQEFRQETPVLVSIVSALLSIFGLWIWTVANADNPDLKTRPRSDDAVGGDVDRELEGSTEGFVQ